MKPGDAYMFSDPYEVGSHVNDTHLFKPIFFKDELIAFGCTVIHWPDMGGPLPGSFNPRATSCYAEGLRIPPIKLFENNELNEELFKFWAYNIRGAEERRGDLAAQYGAASLLEERIQELCLKYGSDTVKLSFEEQFNYTERLLFSELDKIEDGEWEFDDYGDIKRVSNISSYSLTNSIPELGISGTFLYGISTQAHQGEWGDPGVYTLLQQNICPLNADKYHWLCLKLYVPGELDLTTGAMSRIAWKKDDYDSGLTTDDIVLYPGLREYCFDLKKTKWEPSSSRTWSGYVRYLRIDPHEYPSSTPFYIDSLYVRSDAQSNGIFPVEFIVYGEGQLQVDIYYDSDNSGDDGILIAKDLNITPNTKYTFYWDTHNIKQGSYYIYIKAHNEFYSIPYYSKTYINIEQISINNPISMNYEVNENRDVTLRWSLGNNNSILEYNLYVGFSRDWMCCKIPLGNIKEISFPNIPPGRYYATITGINSLGEETPFDIKEIIVK